jgi:hypothetical protein
MRTDRFGLLRGEWASIVKGLCASALLSNSASFTAWPHGRLFKADGKLSDRSFT